MSTTETSATTTPRRPKKRHPNKGNNLVDSEKASGDTEAAVYFVPTALRQAFPFTTPQEHRLVIALTAYFDESGTHAGSPDVTVAGFLSTPELWAKFEIQWAAVLKEYDLDCFHMKEFSHSIGRFKGWSKERHNACYARLLGIINEFAIGSVGSVIPVATYANVISPQADALVGGPYGLAADLCLLSIANMLQITRVSGDVHYVFEAGGEGWGQIHKMYQHHLKTAGGRQATRLSGIQVAPKEQFAPLQAADILAYELHKAFPRQTGTDPRPQRLFPMTELRRIPGNWSFLDEMGLRRIGRLLDARAELSDKEAWSPPVVSMTPSPAIALSLPGFRAKWEWAAQFMGEGRPLREPL